MAIFNKIKNVPIENSLNAVIYARYSSSNQTENSIDGQLRECKRYAELHGYSIINTYIDRAASGTNDNRTEFQNMIDDAKKQNFAFIIVYRFDRFARNRYDSAIYKKRLEESGVKVLSATENVGTGDEGLILESIYEAMDEAYSRRLSRITKRGMRETALKGLWTGGHAPFGYDVVDQKLVINEKEAETVRYIFNEIENFGKQKDIISKLDAQGCRTKSGKKITIQVLEHLLQSELYTGKRKFQDVEIEIPRIISDEQFNKVQKIVSATKKKVGKPPEENFFFLSGKLFCGECGSTMVGDSGTSRNGNKHYYYTCGNKKKGKGCRKKSEKKDFIEWYICEQTVLHVLTDENISKIAKAVIAKQKEDSVSKDINNLEKSLKAIDKEFDKLTDALIKAPTDEIAKRVGAKSKELELRREQLQVELLHLQMIDNIKLKEKDVINYLQEFKKGNLFDLEFRHKIIKALINSIYLYDDKIVIYFNLKNSKLVSYIDMLSDLEQHTKMFEQFKVQGAKKKRHDRVRVFSFSLLLWRETVSPLGKAASYEVAVPIYRV